MEGKNPLYHIPHLNFVNLIYPIVIAPEIP